jgi:shikimate kinase
MEAVLVGFMGTGKTTIGSLLAQKLAVPHFDLDQVIVEQANQTINEIFKNWGENKFRQLEHQLLLTEIKKDGVLSTGGGTPILANNLRALQQINVPVILLEASIGTIFTRVSNNQTRPLVNQLSLDQLQKLKFNRDPKYYACADFVVKTDHKKPEIITAEILSFLKQKKSLTNTKQQEIGF